MNPIILIRHVVTDMAGTFCGHSDPELNEDGKRRLPELATKLAGILRGECAPIMFTSDLKRAAETAASVAAHFKTIAIPRTGLREIYFGEWEGLTWNEIEARDAFHAKRWIDDHPNCPPPGGETWHHFHERISREAAFLMQAAQQSPLVVVTHAGVIRTLLESHFKFSPAMAWQSAKDYGSVVVANAESTTCLTTS